MKIKEKLNDIWIDFYYCKFLHFICGLKNILFWRSTIWNDRNFDHSFMFRLMAKKYERMEKYFRHEGIAADNLYCAKICMILKNVCIRLYEQPYFDSYYDTKNNIGILHSDSIIDYEEYMEKQDLRYLGILMEKYSRSLWD